MATVCRGCSYANNKDTAKFCGQCGKPLSTTAIAKAQTTQVTRVDDTKHQLDSFYDNLNQYIDATSNRDYEALERVLGSSSDWWIRKHFEAKWAKDEAERVVKQLVVQKNNAYIQAMQQKVDQALARDQARFEAEIEATKRRIAVLSDVEIYRLAVIAVNETFKSDEFKDVTEEAREALTAQLYSELINRTIRTTPPTLPLNK